MRSQVCWSLAAAAVLAACSNGGYAASPAGTGDIPGLTPAAAPPPAGMERAGHKKKSFVYWTLFASCSYPQIQWAAVPLKAKSKAKSLDCSKQNGLSYTSGLTIDSAGRLWVLSFSKSGGSPSEAAVFQLPLTPASVQEYTFILSGTSAADAIAFDPSGNLWVSSPGNAGVLEYTGPFKTSGTLKPAMTIAVPSGYKMYDLALDKSANLYATNAN